MGGMDSSGHILATLFPKHAESAFAYFLARVKSASFQVVGAQSNWKSVYISVY